MAGFATLVEVGGAFTEQSTEYALGYAAWAQLVGSVGFGASPAMRLLSVDASTSTGEGTRYTLPAPLKYWGLQVVSGSCTADVRLSVGIASSSDATLTEVVAWAASSGGGGQTSGETVWTTVSKPALVVSATVEAGASSGGVSAWVAGRA